MISYTTSTLSINTIKVFKNRHIIKRARNLVFECIYKTERSGKRWSVSTTFCIWIMLQVQPYIENPLRFDDVAEVSKVKTSCSTYKKRQKNEKKKKKKSQKAPFCTHTPSFPFHSKK